MHGPAQEEKLDESNERRSPTTDEEAIQAQATQSAAGKKHRETHRGWGKGYGQSMLFDGPSRGPQAQTNRESRAGVRDHGVSRDRDASGPSYSGRIDEREGRGRDQHHKLSRHGGGYTREVDQYRPNEGTC